MTTSTVSGTAVQVVSDIMEQFAFLFPLQISKDEFTIPAEQGVETTICFTGPQNGELRLLLPQSLCTEIAANVLGIEPEDRDAAEKGPDAACELLNMICGRFISDHYGNKDVFELDPPTADAPKRKRWKTMLKDPDSIAFSMMEGSFLLQVNVEE